MVNVEIRVTPFALDRGRYTTIIVDQHNEWLSGNNSKFFSYVIQKPIRRWMCPYRERVFVWHGFLPALMKEINEDAYSFQFSGTQEDYAFFERELRYQAEHSALERLKIDVSLKENIDMARISDDIQSILRELYDNSTISKTQKRQLRYIRKQLKPSGFGIMMNEEPCTSTFSMIQVRPEDTDLSDVVLKSVSPVVYIFLMRADIDMACLPEVISYLKKLDYEQLDHTYIYLYGSSCIVESGWFTRLTNTLRKNGIYVKGIKTFESVLQIQEYLSKDIGRSIFWEQNVNDAIHMIEDSILHNNASEDVVHGYQNFRNSVFAK